MQRVFQAIILSALVAPLGKAALFDYFVTSPDMRWAYSVEAEPTRCVVRVRLSEAAVVTQGDVVSLEPGGPVAWPKPGEPELPVLPVVVRVEAGTSYRITIEPGAPRVQAIGTLRPVAEQRAVSVDDGVSRVVERRDPDPGIYASTNVWPDQWYTVHEAADGASRFVRIGLMPFRYRPSAGEVEMYTELVMTMDFSPGGVGAP